jgi:hypothetical protein
MAIDFTLTPQHRKLQLQSREFARDILPVATSAELLPTPEERFLATKPIYEAMVAAGFLRKCIPAEVGGESAGMVELAILAEEFYCINASVSLTMIGTLLGLLPILLGGTAEQRDRLLISFLKKSGASARPNRAAAPMRRLLLPARAFVQAQSLRARIDRRSTEFDKLSLLALASTAPNSAGALMPSAQP